MGCSESISAFFRTFPGSDLTICFSPRYIADIETQCHLYGWVQCNCLFIFPE